MKKQWSLLESLIKSARDIIAAKDLPKRNDHKVRIQDLKKQAQVSFQDSELSSFDFENSRRRRRKCSKNEDSDAIFVLQYE